ncbi:hypothetical protein F4802DRAFT_124549 [Xylaria palmicola]|nr:hypothetical protein F4802DRAFT_124549 [Xylaria palmicola]
MCLNSGRSRLVWNRALSCLITLLISNIISPSQYSNFFRVHALKHLSKRFSLAEANRLLTNSRGRAAVQGGEHYGMLVEIRQGQDNVVMCVN